ncbi:MAG: DUF58 domain-containing protein [Planctomycetes bacterium]|nr:DUF58 domain-containing protein [Planctomycetota bacterium]
MLPSPRLIILVMAAAPLFLGGALFDPFVAIGVIYVTALSVYAVIDALLLPRRKSVEVERIVPERLSLGAPTRIVFEVRNRCRRPVKIHLAEDLPEHMNAEPAHCVGMLASGARGTFEYRLTARKRGRYDLGTVDVRVLPLTGLFYRQFRLRLSTQLEVFPNLVNLKRYELLLRRGLSYEQGVARIKQQGQGTEFESMRHHTPGDGMSRVDWKATAKRRRLIVRNYQPERQQSVLVAIDVGRATAGEFEGLSRLDYYVNAVLMLAYVAMHQSDWFSLVAFSDRIESYLPPVKRLKNIDKVARALYELEPRLVEADYTAFARFVAAQNRKRSLICLMTDVIDKDASGIMMSCMARFARHHLPLTITLSDPEVKAAAEEPLAHGPDIFSKAVALDVLEARAEALAAMRRQGVGVLEAHPHAVMPDLINRYLLIKSARRL